MEPRAFSPKDAVAVYPGVGTTGTLANLRVKKRGPRFFKVGRKVVYRAEDIEAYLFARPVLTRDSVELGDSAEGGR
jgi:orotidine-5'-phosphate decarboxylase